MRGAVERERRGGAARVVDAHGAVAARQQHLVLAQRVPRHAVQRYAAAQLRALHVDHSGILHFATVR